MTRTCDIRNQRWRDLNPIQILQMVLDFPGAHALRVQGNDLVLNTCHVRLVLLDHQWFEFTQAVTGDGNFLFAIFARDGFLAFPVPTVGCGFRLRVMFFYNPGACPSRPPAFLARSRQTDPLRHSVHLEP
jgi:hypothetical protein